MEFILCVNLLKENIKKAKENKPLNLFFNRLGKTYSMMLKKSKDIIGSSEKKPLNIYVNI